MNTVSSARYRIYQCNFLMATPRRSSRLESKAKEKLGKVRRWPPKRAIIAMDDEEEEEEEDTDDSGEAVLPRERKSFPPKDKINNFVKVLVDI